MSDDSNKLLVDDSKANVKSFNFTRVFSSNSDQLEVFHTVCVPVIDELINSNKSALIFTYGLTNSGKTFTITGIDYII